jgi:hypothetical protein
MDSVVLGIGMALFEQTTYDPQNGAPINSNLADYMMTVNADAPPIDVHFLDYSDKEINELGARGIGEIGLAGVAAAISDVIHHATGVRSRKVLVVSAIELMAEKGRMRLPDLVLTMSEAMRVRSSGGGEGDFARGRTARRTGHTPWRREVRKEAACSSRVEHNGVLRERERIYGGAGGAPNNLQGLAGSMGGAFGVNFRMTNSCRRFATAPVAMPIAPFSKVNPAPLRS